MKIRFILWCVILLAIRSAYAQGTAFTYQGRLNDHGSPANGNYDLIFTLFTTNNDVTPIAGPITNLAVRLEDGLFSVAIDFGSNAFNGDLNWMEIAVRTNGDIAFNTLTPRQELTPTPYAIFAGTAANVLRTNDINFSGVALTNVGTVNVSGSADIAGQEHVSTLILTNDLINQSLAPGALVASDASRTLSSVPNGAGALTNDGNGNFGFASLLDASTLTRSTFIKTDGNTNLISTFDGQGLTNTIAYQDEGSETNIVATFNGTLQSFTLTNGPDLFFSYAGANGSVSYRIISKNFSTLHFSYQPKWLAGSNNVITNGVLSLTSYGGTNANQVEAAIGEFQ